MHCEEERHAIWGGGYMPYEEEDTCHMRRRIHVIWGGGYISYEEEDTCHMTRRMHYEEERRAYAQVSKETCYRGKRDPVTEPQRFQHERFQWWDGPLFQVVRNFKWSDGPSGHFIFQFSVLTNCFLFRFFGPYQRTKFFLSHPTVFSIWHGPRTCGGGHW